MEFADIVKYIVDNLSIELDQTTEFGPEERLKIKLLLGQEVISEDWCTLPGNE